METNWQEFLGAAGARFAQTADGGAGEVSDFGDPAAELCAAREATVISPLAHLSLVECSGDDAKSFLHNQLTSDVNHLDAQSAQHAAWCTAKGRMLASFVLYRTADGYRALLAADLAAATVKRLQIYILRAKVKLADITDTHVALGISGADAEAALADAGLPTPQRVLENATFSEGNVIRLDATRLIVIVERGAAAALWKQLSARARAVGTPTWRWLDVRAGLPLVSDATREAFVPQMADFDKIGGVSFNKGCYPGQEVVARTRYLGKVKRHLYRLHADVELSAGSPLFAPASAEPEHPCGMVANAAPAPGGGYDALAVIQEGFVAAADLAIGASDGVRIATIEAVNTPDTAP